MSTYQANPIELQKIQLLANIQQIFDNKKESGEKLPTGRRISTAHKGVIHGLVELWAIHYYKTKSATLRTNRGNLGDAFWCSERSTYNYLLDLHHLNILHWQVREEDARGWIEIDIVFYSHLFLETAPQGDRQTDENSHSPLNGKVCRIQYTNLKNNIENNSFGALQRVNDVETVQKIEAEQKKAERGQQKAVAPAKMAVPTETMVKLDPNFNKEFRAAPEDERKDIEFYANRLWQQAWQSLWHGRRFRKEVVEEGVKIFAIALLQMVEKNKEKRAEAVKAFYNFENVKNSKHKNKSPMLANFLAKQGYEISAPFRAAFSTLSRAIEVQRENCQKHDYNCYYPTVYLSEYYDKAVKYTLIEQRTMTQHKEANQLRRDHCAAKLKIENYISKGIITLRKFGKDSALESMRTAYREYRTWLQTTGLKDQQKYLNRFASQVNCMN